MAVPSFNPNGYMLHKWQLLIDQKVTEVVMWDIYEQGGIIMMQHFLRIKWYSSNKNSTAGD